MDMNRIKSATTWWYSFANNIIYLLLWLPFKPCTSRACSFAGETRFIIVKFFYYLSIFALLLKSAPLDIASIQTLSKMHHFEHIFTFLETVVNCSHWTVLTHHINASFTFVDVECHLFFYFIFFKVWLSHYSINYYSDFLFPNGSMFFFSLSKYLYLF